MSSLWHRVLLSYSAAVCLMSIHKTFVAHRVGRWCATYTIYSIPSLSTAPQAIRSIYFISSRFRYIYSGTLVNSIGFEWMLVGIAILCFIYAPLLTFLRAPPTKEEKKVGDSDANVNTMTNGSGGGDAGLCNPGFTKDTGELAVIYNATNCMTKL